MVGSRIYPLLFLLRSIGICYKVWVRSALFVITLFHQCPVLATAQRVKKSKILFPLGILWQKSNRSLLLWKVINCVAHTVRIAVLLVTVLLFCWSCDWNSVQWLMCDIDLHSLLGADEVSGDAFIDSQKYMYCYWRSPQLHVHCCCCSKDYSISDLFLFPLFFSIQFHLFPVCLYVVRSEISITLHINTLICMTTCLAQSGWT